MNLENKVVAVTGASGMLGVYIARALLAAGAKVRGVVRNPEKAAFLEHEGVTFAKADLADCDALAAAFQGADAIVSNAALYSPVNLSWDANYKANKEGTENVYQAVVASGVKRVVQISTFGVYKMRPGASIQEDSAQLAGEKRQGGAYRATKQLSEKIAWEVAKQHGLQLTTLRPPGIYGARDTNLILPLLKFFKSPLLPVPTASFPFVYAADVAQAVVGALKNDASIGKAYNTGGGPGSILEFVKALKEARGKGPVLLPLPIPLKFMIDSSLAERELGFRSRPFIEGLREVIAEDAKEATPV